MTFPRPALQNHGPGKLEKLKKKTKTKQNSISRTMSQEEPQGKYKA